MANRPLVIGLTGSIGMGKSETAHMFARLGVPVYSADAAVHALYDTGGAAVEPVGAAFPGVVVDGRIDRSALAAAVMADNTAFDRLNAIVHPLVAKEQRTFIDKAAANGIPMVVLDIPLLLETGGEQFVDAVVVVSAPETIQRARVLERDGMTAEKLDTILARQIPDAEKRARADYVVETGAGRAHAFEEVRKIIAQLRSRRSS